MQTRIEKWGEGLALRIPPDVAAQAQLQNNSLVEVSLVGGKLVVAPVARRTYSLEELLAGITEQNLHAEVETGPRMGNEAW